MTCPHKGYHSLSQSYFKQHAARAVLMAWQGILSGQDEEILKFVRLYQSQTVYRIASSLKLRAMTQSYQPTSLISDCILYYLMLHYIRIP